MWRTLPVVLSLALLGAHYFRAGTGWAMVACLVLAALLFVPRPWAARVLQLALAAGALEWIRTLVLLAGQRAAAGEPAARLAGILGTVAALTLASALVFRHPRLRRYYGLADGAANR
ncbi:MAG: hypothetical protein P8080_11385 [Gammaproteobacteria bacterium]